MANLSQKKMYPGIPNSVEVKTIEQANHAIENHRRHLQSLATHADFQDSLFKSTFLVEGDDISSLSVGKLTAGTINVDGIMVGTGIELAGFSNQIKVGLNDNIVIDGATNTIQIYDNQTIQQLRILHGQLGATDSVLRFNGSSTVVDCGNPASLTENIYAIELQFKLDVLPSVETHNADLVMKDGKISIYIDNADDTLKVWDFNGATARDTGQVITTGRWYHVFFFVSNGTTNGEVWLDGELVLEDFAYNDASDLNNLFIGSNNSTNWTNGWIREVRYWGTSDPAAMTASEVRSLDVQNLPTTVRPTKLSPLRHYWPLDDGAGTVAANPWGALDGTITGGTWETIDDNYGIRAASREGEVHWQISDKTYINGGALINQSVDGGQAILDASIVDAKMLSVDWAKINNVAIVNADIVNLSASKINTGTLDAGVVTVSNLNAASINAGTLTVDGSPAISVTGSGAMTFTSGGDIEMTATSSDFNYINFYNSTSSLRGQLGLKVSGGFFTIRAPNASTGLWVDSLGDVLIYAGTSKDIVLGDNVVTNTIRIRGELEPYTDSTYGIGNSGIEWVDVWADDTSINDLQFGNSYVLTEISEAFQGTTLDDGLVLLDNSEPSNVVAVFSNDGNIYIPGTVKSINDWAHKNKPRKPTSVERKRKDKYADDYILQPTGRWIRKKQAGWKRDPITKGWLTPQQVAQGLGNNE